MTDSSLSGWSGVLLPDSISGAGSKKQCRLPILARAKKQSNYYNTTDITKQCPALVDKVPIVSSSQASPHKRSWSSVSNTKPSQYQHSQANQISQQTQSLVSNPRHRLVSRSNNFHCTLGRTLAFNLWSLPQQRNNKLKDSIFSIPRPFVFRGEPPFPPWKVWDSLYFSPASPLDGVACTSTDVQRQVRANNTILARSRWFPLS